MKQDSFNILYANFCPHKATNRFVLNRCFCRFESVWLMPIPPMIMSTSPVDYCNSLLYGLPASHLNKVQRVLNAAARLVCRAPRYCRITPLLYELHWLPVRQRISFKILLFVFKAIHGFAPTYLRELVSIKRSGNYNLRSSSDGLLLATPTYRSRVTLGDRSFQVAAPALWNVLPREIRSITDLGIFKCHLKTHLFREAFY